MKASQDKIISLTLVTLLVVAGVFLSKLQHQLKNTYNSLASEIIYDRNGTPISYTLNPKGYRADYIETLPNRVKKLMLRKEDRWFYIHPGINPVSTLRAVKRKVLTGTAGASSTITQQLTKNLLGNETQRTIKNKMHEAMASFALELFTSKRQILIMYANSVYLGNGNQGMERASQSYFGKSLDQLSDPEILSLLATLSNPTTQNPRTEKNIASTATLADTLNAADGLYAYAETETGTNFATAFELQGLDFNCPEICTLSIDKKLTEDIREMLRRTVEKLEDRGVSTGAVVIISVPQNELLAIVGSPDPFSEKEGQAINMALKPRPIGSTAKPFIYAKGFEANLRPYTLVNDREYKYNVADGFSIYPKNFDGFYRGEVTLHTALSNSLNVPTVKVLEHVGISNFYGFLENELDLKLLQPAGDYQLGAALGTLELDPLTLGHIMTIFPNEGTLYPLSIGTEKPLLTPMGSAFSARQALNPEHTQLVTKILADRITGADQFGTVNNLSLPYQHYAVKTGTSRDFHDSWTVGYTPDYVVVTWLGNAENYPLNNVTGHSGAGALWNEVMQYMINSNYTTNTPFSFEKILPITVAGQATYGIPNESPDTHRHLITDQEIILSPHNNDRILFDTSTSIPLMAKESVSWSVNNNYLGTGERIDYRPTKPGAHTLRATTTNGTVAAVTIELVDAN